MNNIAYFAERMTDSLYSQHDNRPAELVASHMQYAQETSQKRSDTIAF